MRAWYDVFHSDFNNPADEPGIRSSQKAVDALIEREIQRGIASRHILLAGFSQGGCDGITSRVTPSQSGCWNYGVCHATCLLRKHCLTEACAIIASIPILWHTVLMIL